MTILASMRRVLALVFLVLVILTGACRQEEPDGGDVTPEGPGASVTMTPTAQAAPEATLPPAAGVATPAGRAITLTLWANPDIPIVGEGRGNARLLEQISAFDADRPAIAVEIAVKSLSGQGSILNYLRVGKATAPTVMPDLILIPSNQLAIAADDQLVYPLEALLPSDAIADLFPAADALGRHDGRLIGYPFATRRLLHLAYNEAAITEALPDAWADFVNRDDVDLILPAAGPEIGRFVLAFYLAQGGTLTNEANRPQLSVEILTEALTLLRDGRQSGLITLRSSNVPDLTQAWQSFQSGESNATLVTAADFLRYRAEGQFAGFATVPGLGEPLPARVETWVWAVSTADPVRQQAAADLITWLVTTENLGVWSWEALSLPGRAGAFQEWPEDDYVAFLRDEMERARAYPPTASATYMEALEDAAFNVVSLQMTPAEAAEQAAATVQP